MKISKRDVIKKADGIMGFQPQPASGNKNIVLPGKDAQPCPRCKSKGNNPKCSTCGKLTK